MGILDDISDFFDDISYEAKSFFEDGVDAVKTIAEAPGEISAAFQEFGKEVKEMGKECEKEIAYDIHPVLGEAVEKKQIVFEKIENLINAPANLLTVGKIKEGEYDLAEHLFVRRGAYTHHGIYIGNGNVIHYSTSADEMIEIHPVTLEEFSNGNTIYYLPRDKSPLTYSKEEAVERAWRRVGEENYNLVINNCEQFVRWCRCGKAEWNE